MTIMRHGARKGTSLIDLLMSIAIVAVLFGGIYLIYFSIITSISNISVRTAAASAISAEIETIRNLPYDQVGTIGGVPSGVIPQGQTMTVGPYTFNLFTTIRNIDDPFDGTVNGTPADTAPADYKLVSIEATCPLCTNNVSVTVTTTAAPKALESATQNGSLFLYAIDANGIGVPGATVHVVNSAVSPTIDLTDTTNASGSLQLVGVPTSTQGYQIFVSKPGYSSEQTYPVGAAGNPNPVLPNATVAAQTVTSVTFAIDRTSSLTIHTTDDRCNAMSGVPLSIAGGKLIGTSPDVLKFSTTTTTNASGLSLFGSLEWDTYAITMTDGTKDIQGTTPLVPLTINPSTTVDLYYTLRSAADPSLLVTPIDATTGQVVPGGTMRISKTGYSAAQTAGHSFVTNTDWSGGNYAVQSGGIDANSAPGSISLMINASGTYDTGVTQWLESNTIDLGGTSTAFYTISWNPVSEPLNTTLEFQVAANNDNATWNFVGPDGTAATYFATPSSSMPSFTGNRYLRYKAYLSTNDSSTTPTLDDITFEFTGDCVPQAQSLFTGLPTGTYTVIVDAPNYAEGSSTVSVGTGEATTTVLMTHV